MNEMTCRSVVNNYYISDIPSLINNIQNHIESNVTLTFQLNQMGMVTLKKAELLSQYATREDRVGPSRRMFGRFYSRHQDPHVVLKKQTNPLTIQSMIEHVTVLPMSKEDFKESSRK